ncbi:LysR family transcriptional regulator [Labilithrix luteola]|uniref:LysR family transcriptional regulator n=1 Tax=Labilithrix luteola TaxID=1391654 RepID=UPI0011BAC52F|nr:LysR family transcriptional regulator [Labilithrix luteola]
MAFDLEHIVDLALFARIVDARSFSEAARRTGIAKSAVSRRIALLEKRLGVQLLRRSTRALDVTSDGARFYEHCVKVLEAARAAEDAVSGSGVRMRGVVRISAPVTFSQMYLAAAVAKFQLEHPAVDVQLTTNDRFVDAVAGEFDLVVRVTRLEDGSFVAKRLASDRLVVAGSPAYLAARGRPLRAEDLVHHQCLHYTLVDAAAEWRFRGSDRKPVALARGAFSANNGTVLKEAMLAGLGLAVLPSFMVASEVRAGRAELVLEGLRRAEIGIYAVVSNARGLPLRVRTLIEHLQRHFADPDWRIPPAPATVRKRTTSRRA